VEVTAAATAITLDHEADVGGARRLAIALASDAGLGEARTSDLALVVTEIAANVVRHAGNGGVLLAIVQDGAARGVSVTSWDRGPGMRLEECLRDGMSTAGTRGVGLGAISRLATRWDAYTRPGAGTVLVALVLEPAPPREGEFELGGVCIPYPGETVSGDGWDARQVGDALVVIACDGLGHGVGAGAATAAVLASFRKSTSISPAELLDAAHGIARPTRGAAATVARIDAGARTVTVAGVGNVTPWLLGPTQRQLVTQHGTLGQAMPRLREETYPCPADTRLVLCSDGLKSRWDLSALPALLACHPSTIAATLWRDFARERDDATVVVARAR